MSPTPPEGEAGAALPFSPRMIALLEVISVTMSILLTVWAVLPLQLNQRWLVAGPGLLALVLIVYSQRVRGETPSDLGFSRRHFGKALSLLLIPMLAGAALFLVAGYGKGTLNIKPHFWRSVALLPAWGLMQQYILQAFVYRRFRFLLVRPELGEAEQRKRTRLAILLTALLFALVHAPNPLLMGLALAGGLVWSWVYERAPNLFALAVSHSVMTWLVVSTIPPSLLHHLRVGLNYFS